MTLWHTITSAASATPVVGSIVALLQRLGTLSGDGEPGRALAVATPASLDSVKFTMAIIALSAKLAKSDGAVTWDEIEAFRQIMHVPEDEEKNVRRLFDLAKQDVAGFEAYARQVGLMLGDDVALVRDVLEGLFVIAAADGVLHEREDDYLKSVAGHLGLAAEPYVYLRSLFFAAPMGAYETLGLAFEATDVEVKLRHRMLVKEHHPDRLSGLGCTREHVVRAERKLAQINAAFDVVAKERGL